MNASMHELASVCSLRQAAGLFVSQPSPRIFGSATAGALALRLSLRRPRAADAMAIGVVASARPIAEWVIHKYVLHAAPIEMDGRVFDPGAAHRRHHLDPADVDFVLVQRQYAAGYAAAWAGIVGGLVVVLPGSRRRRLRPALSGLSAAYLALAGYEWIHLLIHTSYRPRGRWFAARRRQHRLHHFRNERYWYGVTTSLADRVLGTAPAPRAVAASATARTLGY